MRGNVGLGVACVAAFAIILSIIGTVFDTAGGSPAAAMEKAQLQSQADAAKMETDKLRAEVETLRAELKKVTAENDALRRGMADLERKAAGDKK